MLSKNLIAQFNHADLIKWSNLATQAGCTDVANILSHTSAYHTSREDVRKLVDAAKAAIALQILSDDTDIEDTSTELS